MNRDRNAADSQALFDRGKLALESGDFPEAVECFSRAIRLRPTIAAGYHYRAYAYREIGDRVKALNDLDQAIRLKPDDTQLYADRAAELFAQKVFPQAIADCDSTLRLDPGRADIHGLRGRCRAELGSTEPALQDYARAISEDPDNAPRYLLWRAKLHFECENYSAARADCDRALLIDPDDPGAYSVRAQVLQAEGNPAAAAADFTEVIRLAADPSWAYLGRAISCFAMKDYPRVIADCDRVAESKARIFRVYELRGTARKALGDLDGAMADFNLAAQLAPSNPLVYSLRADVNYLRKDFAAAVRDHMEALKCDPGQAGSFNQLAWVWATCPDPEVRNGERARECATRACELTEWQESSYLDTLSAACAECGEFEEAIRWQEKAISMATTPERVADYQTRLALYRMRKPARVEPRMVE